MTTVNRRNPETGGWDEDVRMTKFINELGSIYTPTDGILDEFAGCEAEDALEAERDRVDTGLNMIDMHKPRQETSDAD